MIAIIVLLMSVVGSKLVRQKNSLTLFMLFCLIWLVVLVLGKLNLIGMYPVSQDFYDIVSVGIIFWILGYLIVRASRVRFTLSDEPARQSVINYKTNTWVLKVYAAIMTVFIVLVASRTIVYLLSGNSYSQMHKYVSGTGEEELFTSAIVNKAHDLIMYPILLAVIPVSAIILFKEKNKLPGVACLMFVVAYALVSGRRMLLSYVIVDFLISLSMFSSSVPRKVKRAMIFAGILAVALVLLMTAWRRNVFSTGNWYEVYRQLYLYATLCLQVGDHWLKVIRANQYFTYGYSFLRGIVTLVHLGLSPLGVRFYSAEIATIYNMPQTIRVFIGNTQTANAFTTWAFYFYLDFRMVGVILGSLLFGGIVAYGENVVRSKPNSLTFAYYLLLSEAVLKSIIRWEFAVPEYIMAFIFLRFLLRKANVNYVFKLRLKENE